MRVNGGYSIMRDRKKVIEQFAKDVRAVFKDSLYQIILYGSYARGDYRDNSDIDIMILTSLSEQEIKGIENTIYDIAYEYQLSDEVMISVNIKNVEHFNYWLGALPYYDNVRKEGIVLAE